MPTTRIATGDWARGSERQIIEAVQSALVAALRIPDWDRDVVIDLYDESARMTPAGRSERYTRIEIIMFAGRSLNAKRLLYKTLVANLSSLGVPS
jgi:Tautomerase enzyme